MFVRFSIHCALLLATVHFVGCSSGTDTSAPTASINTTQSENGDGGASQRVEHPVVLTANGSSGSAATAQSPAKLKHRVLIRTSLGELTVELDAEKAPVTVDNFLTGYVDRGFYTDTIFHHVDSSMLLATGGYTADLQPKEVRAPIRSEANNGLSNKRGTLAMLRLPEYPDSATSQFLINVVDNPSLDYVSDDDGASFGYCVFGKVVAGMDVVDQIAATPVGPQGDFPAVPKVPVVIQSIERID